MNMENKKTGYILIYRSMLETGLYPKLRKFTDFEAWVDLLLKSNYKDNRITFDMKFIDILRGQLLTSELKLSIHWMWSRDKVRSFLKMLQRDEMIIKESFNKYTIITICNYDNYQDITATEKQQKNTKSYNRKTPNHTQTIKKIQLKKENKETVPYVEVQENFNSICGNILPKCSTLSETRKEKIELRFKEIGSLEKIIEIFNIAIKCDFLCGKNGKKWRADFDWIFTNDTNWVKILEGKYNNKSQPIVRNSEISTEWN